MKVLSMDIGGTNTRIGIFSDSKLVEKAVFVTKDVKSVEDVVAGFLRGRKIADCCIGFAGPIVGNKAKLTNAGLEIDIKKLKEKFSFANLTLVNDFHAAAKGISLLPKKSFMVLNKARFANDVNMVVGPGTGLGKAYIIKGCTYPCEAGLTTLGIENIEEYTVLDYLKKRGKKPVYYEDVISRRGMIDLYDHLEIKNNIEFDMIVRKRIRTIHKRTAEIITRSSGKDELCRQTLFWFVKFYARFVRDSALHLIPSDIYLGGGVSPAIKDYLKEFFMKEFVKHRSYSGLLKKMGVSIILDTDVGLIGAAALASDDCKK